jgi:hypothetical protein
VAGEVLEAAADPDRLVVLPREHGYGLGIADALTPELLGERQLSLVRRPERARTVEQRPQPDLAPDGPVVGGQRADHCHAVQRGTGAGRAHPDSQACIRPIRSLLPNGSRSPMSRP